VGEHLALGKKTADRRPAFVPNAFGTTAVKQQTEDMTMKRLIQIILVLSALGPSHSTLAQGPLTPPSSPGPTMKTLAQIEPRTPRSAAARILNLERAAESALMDIRPKESQLGP